MSSIADRVGGWVLESAAGLVSQRHRKWVDAATAEAASIDSIPQRVLFALSASRAMCAIAARDALRGEFADGRVAINAAAAGIIIAVLDVNASTRWPLRILLVSGCLLLGAFVPRARWRWALLLALPLPVLVLATGIAGPYRYDRADVWLPLIPALLIATLGSAVVRQLFSIVRRLRHDARRT